MPLTAVTLKEIEQIFAVIERLGLSREAVLIPLRPASPGSVKRLPNGKLEIVVDAERPIEEWLVSLGQQIEELMGRGGS